MKNIAKQAREEGIIEPWQEPPIQYDPDTFISVYDTIQQLRKHCKKHPDRTSAKTLKVKLTVQQIHDITQILVGHDVEMLFS